MKNNSRGTYFILLSVLWTTTTTIAQADQDETSTRFFELTPPALLTGSVFHSSPTLRENAHNMNDDYRALCLREFNSMTVSIYLPYGDVWTDASVPIDVTAFRDEVDTLHSKENKLVHGHSLVYPMANLDSKWWLDQPNDDVEEKMYQYIDTLAAATRGKIWTWDVVNEVMGDTYDFNDADGVRIETKHGVPIKEYQAMGQSYISKAFTRAREADPSATLLITDYGCEHDDPDNENDKSDRLFAFVTKLRAQGVPIDGIGFQMHVSSIPNQETSYQHIARNFERFRNAGLLLYITEMDVRSFETYQPGDVPSEILGAADIRQASVYANIMEICLNEPACEALMFWDVAEYNSRHPSLEYSWLHPYRNGPNQGLYTFPTPFWDINPVAFLPKSGWYEMRNAMEAYSGVYRVTSTWEPESSYLLRKGSPTSGPDYDPSDEVGLGTLTAESKDWLSMKWRFERSSSEGLASPRYFRIACRWEDDQTTGYLSRVGFQSETTGEWIPSDNVNVDTLHIDWLSQQWELVYVYQNRYKIKSLWSNSHDYLTRLGLQDGEDEAFVATDQVNLLDDYDYTSQVWILDQVWDEQETRVASDFLDLENFDDDDLFEYIFEGDIVQSLARGTFWSGGCLLFLITTLSATIVLAVG